MRGRGMRGWVLVAASLVGACCTPPECLPEAIPFRGRGENLEEFFQVVQYLALHDCCGNLHGNLSQASRDRWGETKFCLFWESIDLPEYGYALADVVRGGKLVAGVDGPAPGEQFLYVEYEEPGKSNLLARILVVTEGDEEDPRPRLRIALQEQVQAIDERKDARYWWDAGGGPQRPR